MQTLGRGTAKRMRIALVIEDDSVTRRVIADLLLEAGFGVCEAFSGDLIPFTPKLDVIVSDLVLAPNADRPTVRDWTSRIADRLRAPVVVVTGRAEMAAEDPAALGAVDVILKPFDIDDLVERVERAIAPEWTAA
jgi:CheY-like chemotaxis protein